jgi:hypothetical protein
MAGITRIGILPIGSYIGLITVILGRPTRTHLSAKEEHNPDQERDGDDQRRRQRLQIGEHAGLLSCWSSFRWQSSSHCDS